MHFLSNNKEGKEDKTKTLPKELLCAVKYDFRTKTIILCFSDGEWDWSRISISGMYKLPQKNIVITEKSFEYVETDYIYNFAEKQKFTQIYKASIADIERNVVANRFSVKIAYMFLEDPNMQHFATEYFFEVRFCTLDIQSFDFAKNSCLTGAVLSKRDQAEH